MVKTESGMREMKIEKVVLSCAGIGDKLEKSVKMLKIITNKNPQKTKSRKRIPAFNIRPGLEIGCIVTIRGNEAIVLLKKLLSAVNNRIKKKQISINHFSFGIPEYIEIPGVEYVREIGILGFNVAVVFSRKGKRTVKKKYKKGKLPSRQHVSIEEIVNYMEKNFKTEIIGGKHDGE